MRILFLIIAIWGSVGRADTSNTFWLPEEVPNVHSIRIVGAINLTTVDYLNQIQLKKGDILQQDQITKFCSGVNDLLVRMGYHRARCEVRTERVRENQYRVVLKVDEGPGARISEIIFLNDGYELSEELTSKLQRLGAGYHHRDLLSEDRLRAYRERLRDYLREEFYYFARIENPIPEMNPEGTLAKLRWPIKLGPRVAVDVSSVPYFNRWNKLLVRQIWGEHETQIIMDRASFTDQPTDFKESLQRGVEALLKTKGYVDAEVGVEVVEFSSQAANYKVTAQEGIRYRWGTLTLEGADQLPVTGVKRFIMDGIKRLGNRWFWQTVWFDEAALRTMIDQVVESYRRQGFLLVSVGSVGVSFRSESNRRFADVVVRLSEGPITRIRTLRVEHNNVIPAEEIATLLQLKEGNVFDVSDLPARIDLLKSRYYTKGFVQAEVMLGGNSSPEFIDYSADNRWADVVVRITEGRQFVVRHVRIRGNFDTSSAVVLRSLKLHPGRLYTGELHQGSINELTSLGAFSSVNISPSFQPDGFVDLLVEVRELEPGSIEGGPGFGSEEGVRGFGRASYSNLLGRAHTISGRVDANRRINSFSFTEYRLSLNYEQPYLMEVIPVRARYTLGHRKRDTRTFDFLSKEAGISLGRALFPWITLSTDFNLIKVHQFNTLVAEDDGTFTIGSVAPSVFVDFRDDPFQTTKGIWFQVESEFASPRWGSQNDIDFIKPQASLNLMMSPIDRWSLRQVFRGGVLISQQSGRVVPASKRFRLGGGATVRGFKDDEINLSETRGLDAIAAREINGLQKMSMVNIRNESTVWMTDSIGWVVFWDLGNVYQGLEPQQRFAPKPAGGFLRQGYGSGIRLGTPIGPFNLEAGWRDKRLENEDRWRVYFSLGLL